MEVGFLECYVLMFLSVAAAYAFIAGWTPFFYRKKSWGQLSRNELKVKQGTATLENRFDLFFRSMVSSLFVWQAHLVALLLTAVIWFFYSLAL